MTCTLHRTEELRQRGFRMTSQRQAILHILIDGGGHLSPSEMAKNEMINPAQTASGHLVYEISGDDHHHLICRMCGREVQVEHAWVRSTYEQIEARTNFHISMSHLTIFGVCPECLKV
jgi:Fur family ferric uptake transcriptional regulator